MQAHGDFVFKPYAVPRPGIEPKWDGCYDLFARDGNPLRRSIRVPSPEGFDDPELACVAAEILAEWDIRDGYGMARAGN